MQINENRAPKTFRSTKNIAPEIYVCVQEEVQEAAN